MKISKIIKINEILNDLIKVKVSSKTAYKLYKFKKELEESCVFYNTRLIDLLKDNCELDEKGNVISTSENTFKLRKDRIETFQKQSEELDNLEIDKPNYKFTLEELEPFNLSVEDIYLLDDFIEEE